MIKVCTCKSAYQDKRYGKKRRVFNKTGKTDKARCTACGAEK